MSLGPLMVDISGTELSPKTSTYWASYGQYSCNLPWWLRYVVIVSKDKISVYKSKSNHGKLQLY